MVSYDVFQCRIQCPQFNQWKCNQYSQIVQGSSAHPKVDTQHQVKISPCTPLTRVGFAAFFTQKHPVFSEIAQAVLLPLSPALSKGTSLAHFISYLPQQLHYFEHSGIMERNAHEWITKLNAKVPSMIIGSQIPTDMQVLFKYFSTDIFQVRAGTYPCFLQPLN